MRAPIASAAPDVAIRGCRLRARASASLPMGQHATPAAFRERYGSVLGGQGQAQRDRVAVAERFARQGATDMAPADGHAVGQ